MTSHTLVLFNRTAPLDLVAEHAARTDPVPLSGAQVAILRHKDRDIAERSIIGEARNAHRLSLPQRRVLVWRREIQMRRLEQMGDAESMEILNSQMATFKKFRWEMQRRVEREAEEMVG